MLRLPEAKEMAKGVYMANTDSRVNLIQNRRASPDSELAAAAAIDAIARIGDLRVAGRVAAESKR